MGLTRIKTYANKNIIYTGSLSVTEGCREQWWEIKESLLYGTDGIKGGNACWAIIGSSDSSGYGIDGTDRWTDRTKVINGTGAHSWVVLQQIGLGNSPGYLQICIDLSNANAYAGTFVFSLAAGFSGGSITARPTATDEIVVKSNTTILSTSSVSSSQGVNCLKSTDGKVNRIIVSRDGVLNIIGLFEQLNNVETYWPSDVVVGLGPCTHTGMGGASNIFMLQSASCSGRVTWQSDFSRGLTDSSSEPGSGMHRPDYGGSWPTYPCGFVIDTGSTKGKVGSFFDMWAVSYAMPTGEYLAGSGGDFEYVNIGGIVQPWVGTPCVVA